MRRGTGERRGMRLLDQVAQATCPIVVEDRLLGRVQLPGAGSFAASVRETTLRYVLQDDVTRVSRDLAFGQAALLTSCLDIVRLPSECMWIEWRDLASDSAVAVAADAPLQRKVGALITSDVGGRTGRIQIIWEEVGNDPTPHPAVLIFDLDGRIEPKQKYIRFSLAESDTRHRALFEHLSMEIQPEWLSYYRSSIGGNVHWSKIHKDLADVVRTDAPFVLAFCLLLSMRTELTFQVAQFARLNEQRRKRQKPALLDHVEIGTTIRRGLSTRNTSVTAGGRATSRLHHVRGHFVRRGDVVFWRSPHLRGNASIGYVANQTKQNLDVTPSMELG